MDRKEYNREYCTKYRHSEAGKAYIAAYHQSEKYKNVLLTAKAKRAEYKLSPEYQEKCRLRKLNKVKRPYTPRKPRGHSIVGDTSIYYWTTDTEMAIYEYQKATTTEKFNQIFNEKLHAPFSKLVECVFNRHKFDYVKKAHGIQDAIQLGMVHMLEVLPKFKEEVGKGKSFGYFSVCIKNYFIRLNQSLYKSSLLDVSIDNITNSSDETEYVYPELRVEDYADFDLNDFLKYIRAYLTANRDVIVNCSHEKLSKARREILDMVLDKLSTGDLNFTIPPESIANKYQKCHKRFIFEMFKIKLGNINYDRLRNCLDAIKPYYQMAQWNYFNLPFANNV